jgi:hypothetical protein
MLYLWKEIMSYTEELYRDIKGYFGLPADAEITGIDQESSYTQGCDTCGHGSGYDFTIDFTYTVNGKPQWATRSGSLAEFLVSLKGE